MFADVNGTKDSHYKFFLQAESREIKWYVAITELDEIVLNQALENY